MGKPFRNTLVTGYPFWEVREMRKLAIVLLALLLLALVFGAVGCNGGNGEGTATPTLTPTPTPKNITLSEMLAMLHENGGEITIKGTSLTAIIDNETYGTVVPESWDVFQEFEAEVLAGTVSVNFERR